MNSIPEVMCIDQLFDLKNNVPCVLADQIIQRHLKYWSEEEFENRWLYYNFPNRFYYNVEAEHISFYRNGKCKKCYLTKHIKDVCASALKTVKNTHLSGEWPMMMGSQLCYFNGIELTTLAPLKNKLNTVEEVEKHLRSDEVQDHFEEFMAVLNYLITRNVIIEYDNGDYKAKRFCSNVEAVRDMTIEIDRKNWDYMKKFFPHMLQEELWLTNDAEKGIVNGKVVQEIDKEFVNPGGYGTIFDHCNKEELSNDPEAMNTLVKMVIPSHKASHIQSLQNSLDGYGPTSITFEISIPNYGTSSRNATIATLTWKYILHPGLRLTKTNQFDLTHVDFVYMLLYKEIDPTLKGGVMWDIVSNRFQYLTTVPEMTMHNQQAYLMWSLMAINAIQMKLLPQLLKSHIIARRDFFLSMLSNVGCWTEQKTFEKQKEFFGVWKDIFKSYFAEKRCMRLFAYLFDQKQLIENKLLGQENHILCKVRLIEPEIEEEFEQPELLQTLCSEKVMSTNFKMNTRTTLTIMTMQGFRHMKLQSDIARPDEFYDKLFSLKFVQLMVDELFIDEHSNRLRICRIHAENNLFFRSGRAYFDHCSQFCDECEKGLKETINKIN